MDINELQFPPPQNWQQFEDLCLAIFRLVWNDPTAQRNGRTGQPQHGTDISGYAAYDAGAHHGVQCKGKEVNYGAVVSEAELRDEIKKAKSFTPPLKHWILATTAPKDAKIEAIARNISAQHEAQGLFRVQVYGWEDVQSHIRQYRSIVEQFYPEFAPAARGAALRLGEYLQRREPADQAAFDAAQAAAAADLQKHLQITGVTSNVLLDLEDPGDRTWQRKDIISDLCQGGIFVLEADPGAGKSTTLLQIAQQILKEDTGVIPLVVPLPEFAESRHGFLDEVSKRSSFRAFEAIVLERLADDGKAALLFDGWNELSAAQRTSVRKCVIKFRREYPNCGLFFSTRTLTPAPVEGATTLRLAPPSRSQQLAILQEKIGDQAEELLKKARRTPGLSDLVRTPLYLVVLAAIGPDGNLPETKDEAVRRFIQKQEERQEHSDALRNTLYDRHESYLRAIALGLAEANAVALPQTEIRSQVARISERLAAARQISEKPDPQHIVDALVSHHTLVERADRDGEPLYSFQHPQFQEWYASFFVEDCIALAYENPTGDNQARLDDVLNAMSWSELIIFAIERLSRKSDAGKAQCAGAILRTLAIDPMLGAEMIRRASAAVWESIKDKVIRFAKLWHQGAESSRALRFMIGTGKPEFSEYVWEAYESEERAVAIAHMPYGWFGAESLGPDGIGRCLRLPTKKRRSLLFNLLHGGGQSGISFAIEACRKDPEPKHVAEILETLWHGGAFPEFYALLSTANADIWKELARHHRLDDANGEFRTRLLDAKKSHLSQGDDLGNLYLLLELAEAGEASNPDLTIDLLFRLKTQDYQGEVRLFERVSALYPQQLSAEILRRMKEGAKVPGMAAEYVAIASRKDQQSVLAQLTREGPPDRRELAALGPALDEESAETLMRELFSIRARQAATGFQSEQQALQVRFQVINDALEFTQPDVLAAVLNRAPVQAAREIAIASKVLCRWHGVDRSEFAESVDPGTLIRLRETVKDWVYAIVPQAQGNRHHLVDVASAIKTVSGPELLTPLKDLLDAELATWKQERIEREKLSAQGLRSSQSNIVYTQIYRQAFATFQGEAVRDVLLQYLGNPDFEVEASFELVRFGIDGERPELEGPMGAPHYERIARARADRRNIGPTNPVAAKVLDRVDRLLARAEADDLGRAIKMATAAVQMETGARMNSIRAVMASRAPMSSLYGLFYVATLIGEQIGSDILIRGFDEAVAEAESKLWRWNNEWWRFNQWLKLLALSDDPQQIARSVAKVQRQHVHIHDFDGIVTALGYGESDNALQALKALAAYAPALVQRHYFADALMRLGTKDAIQYLVDLLFDPPGGNLLDVNSYTLAEQLATACQEHPSIREGIMQRFGGAGDRPSASILRFLLPRIIRPTEVTSLLRHCKPGGGDRHFQLLLDAVRNLAVVDRPLPATNIHEREGQDLTSLRAELFQIYEGNDTHAEAAGLLLLAIEIQHDEYGKPPSEPRHPDIKSGKPWPRAAAVIAEE